MVVPTEVRPAIRLLPTMEAPVDVVVQVPPEGVAAGRGIVAVPLHAVSAKAEMTMTGKALIANVFCAEEEHDAA